LEAVDQPFLGEIDYAMLVKICGESPEPEKRHGGLHRLPAHGHHWKSRSEVHQHQLCRTPEHHDAYVHARFTRLTNAFSKRLENHAAAVALRFMYYNFLRIPPAPPHQPRDGR
jgi:hypothetical protein